MSEYLWISGGTPCISKILLPAVLWNRVNSSATAQAPRQCRGESTCSLQPFLKFITVFPGALELHRVGEPEPIGCWIAAQWYKAPVHAPVAALRRYSQPFSAQKRLVLWKPRELLLLERRISVLLLHLCFRVVLLQAGNKQTEMHSSNAA